MDSVKPLKPLDRKTGLILFGLCFLFTFVAVWGLRQLLIPRDELDCYARVQVLQKAVDQWNQANPSKPITEVIDENALVQAGYLKPLTYDHNLHYYFVGQTVHGPRVKCNKHEDNPMVLKLTGDFLLAILLFVVVCHFRGYVLFPPGS